MPHIGSTLAARCSELLPDATAFFSLIRSDRGGRSALELGREETESIRSLVDCEVAEASVSFRISDNLYQLLSFPEKTKIQKNVATITF